ncbi:MAG TPA: methylmalonyl-CoA mutase family protein, partial [Longimicrobiales bacterium]
WTMRQYAGFGTAEETNRRYHYLLERGQTGLSVAFDLPTQMGYDSDAAMARGEVGRAGVAVDSLEDMRALLRGIGLDAVSTSMTINATAPILLALYVAVADERGVPRERLRGTVQNDILKEYVARGTYIYPVEPSLRLVRDLMAFCARDVPSWNTVSISGYHIREAGSTAPQEVAFTLANGIEYVERALAAGVDLEDFAPRLSFFFAAHNDVLEEVAKFRAARRLWASLMRERYGASDRSCKLRFHAQTGGSTLTAQQPVNNVARVTLQALAAVLGGTQSLHTNGYDEALALPTEASARIALRTQQILAYESGVARTPDPLAGSWYVEALTDEVEARARVYLERIDELGGAARALDYMREEIHRAAYRFQMEVESGARVVVGVNRFQEEDDDVRVEQPDYSALEARQREGLGAWKASRDGRAVDEALERIRVTARGDDNLVPEMVTAVKAGATLGEVSDALRGEWGTYDGA